MRKVGESRVGSKEKKNAKRRRVGENKHRGEIGVESKGRISPAE